MGLDGLDPTQKACPPRAEMKCKETEQLSSKTYFSRNDDFEGAVGTAMDIGATVLKVGFTKVGTHLYLSESKIVFVENENSICQN